MGLYPHSEELSKMIGKRLKMLRQKAQMRQEDLARLLDVAPSTIAMYESDQRKPDTEKLDKIATLFDCSADYLLGRVNKPYLAVFDDLPEELKAEGVKSLEVVKDAIKEGLTAEELADVLNFVKGMNRKKKKD